jgi:prepilin peptidase CpaA
VFHLGSESLYLFAGLFCTGLGAAYDLSSRRVPNFVTLPAALVGLTIHGTLGGWTQLVSSLAAGLLCFSIFLVLYLAGGMGAGDVKLVAAAGCFAGLQHVLSLLFWTALSGGVMAVCLALYRHKLIETIRNLGALFLHHRLAGLRPHPQLNIGNARTIRLPYALAIAAGNICVLCSLLMGR